MAPKRNLIFGFDVSLFVLILSSGMSYLSITKATGKPTVGVAYNSGQVSLDNLISLMKDAETEQRGYAW